MNDHAGHDPLLVARAAGGDPLTAGEASELAARLAACADCRALHAELVAIGAALHMDLPAPRRPRDFRLDAAEAARGRSLGWRARLGGLLGGPSLQPLATAICALGLLLAVGALVLPSGGRPTVLSAAGSAVQKAVAPSAGERSMTGTERLGAPSAALPAPAASAAPAPAAGATAPAVGPSAIGLGGPLGGVRPPSSAFGAASLPPGGAGDVAGAIPPEATPGPSSPAGPDLRALVSAVGLLLVIVGLGAWRVARRRSASTG